MSTVIKAGQAGPVLKHLSTVDLADHLAEADAVVAQARRKAAHIVARTKREAEEAVRRAGESGYEAGHKRGYEQGLKAGYDAAHRESIELFTAQHASIVAAMQGAVAEVDAIKQDLRIAAERDLLDFAVSVASKLTFAIGRTRREAALANLQRALPLVAAHTDVAIRVHPDDLASIEMFAESVLQQVDASRSVAIVADDTLAPGGCKVLSGRTEIDSTLETQVAEMVSLLADTKIDDD